MLLWHSDYFLGWHLQKISKRYGWKILANKFWNGFSTSYHLLIHIPMLRYVARGYGFVSKFIRKKLSIISIKHILIFTFLELLRIQYTNATVWYRCLPEKMFTLEMWITLVLANWHFTLLRLLSKIHFSI